MMQIIVDQPHVRRVFSGLLCDEEHLVCYVYRALVSRLLLPDSLDVIEHLYRKDWFHMVVDSHTYMDDLESLVKDVVDNYVDHPILSELDVKIIDVSLLPPTALVLTVV